jgi:serine O-acetyltransferase
MLIRSDALRVKNWYKSLGFWTVFGYRIRHARKFGCGFCRFLLPFELLFRAFGVFLPDSEIPTTLRIGPSFHLPHPTGVVLAPQCRIGPRVTIFQQVTLGMWEGGCPAIRAHASVFPGAKVIGRVVIGMRAFVGANAVVLIDVPDCHSAVGVPARVQWRSDYKCSGRTQAASYIQADGQ